MNKQKLIERIENLPCFEGPIACTVTVNREWILQSIEQLDEPQKPVVKQFVADWIKYCKNTNVTLARALLVEKVDFYNYANQKDSKKLKDFLKVKDNQEAFASAWLDGYEVEKEKQYLVMMKGMDKDFTILKLDKIRGSWYLGEGAEYSYTKTTHTRKELEEAGFGEVFNSPLFEVEEAE